MACGQGADHPAPAGADAAATDHSLKVSGASQMDACVGVSVEADTLPVDLFAVVDGSGSMGDATTTGVSKWYATKAGFRDFLAHAPSGMGFGLSLFPVSSDSNAACSTERYRSAALPIDDVTQMASGALARLEAVTPHGQTPTGPALSAALDLAMAYALDHSNRSVVVVLATDGLPTLCSPSDTGAIALMAKAALEGPAHVRTLVVASRSLENDDLSGFDAIAVAGGTTRSLVIDPHADFARQLSDALGTAATRKVACDLALPEPPTGQHLDYDAVNVVVDNQKSGRVLLPRVSGPAECSAAGGWYYDVDPAEGPPTRLGMCKSSCERADSSGGGRGARLRVELGCKSLVK